MSDRNSLFERTNVSINKSHECCGMCLWSTSGTRGEDQELDRKSAKNKKRKRTFYTHRDFSFTLSASKRLLSKLRWKPRTLSDKLLERHERLVHTSRLHGVDQNDPVCGYARDLGGPRGDLVHRRVDEEKAGFRRIQLVHQFVYRERRVCRPAKFQRL